MPASASPPVRPPPWEARVADRMLSWGAPRLPERAQPEPPATLAPFERLLWPRPSGGVLDATWYPAAAARARGVVVLAHPWLPYGQAYFHRRGRIEALRRAGYAALTFDLTGFGRTTRAGRFLRDRDVADALALARERAAGAPVHAWGVSSGGYWSMVALSCHAQVEGAMFEDVSPHLIEWMVHAQRSHPVGPRLVARILPRTHAFLDMRRHAPHLRVAACAFAYGARDAGIPEAQARDVARRAGGACLVVPDAGHLEAVKVANDEVVGLALSVFEKSEASAGFDTAGRAPPPPL